MRKTKIVCTIGPASEQAETLRQLILAGMNVARLNFSHGSHEEHGKRVENIKQLREELKLPVALLLDTRGPEIRIRSFRDGKVTLTEGQTFTLTSREVEGDAEIVSITFPQLVEQAKKGQIILLDDGLIELQTESVTDTDIVCSVKNGGELSGNKGVNLPGLSVNMPFLNSRDKLDLEFAYDNDFDFVALSFVRSATDVLEARHYLSRLGKNDIELIAKIENAEGVDNIDDIIRVSNGIMVARGDMGVEIPFEELPHIQKTLISKCYTAGKKVITATQMLESMVRNPRPTRAEITDVANAIYDGTSAIMLSGETASGKYPLEALRTMVKIALETERNINYEMTFAALKPNLNNNVTNAISHATCTTAQDLGAEAIIAVTRGGSTARMISRFRPKTSIIAITPNQRTYRQLALSWGVTPILNTYKETPEELFSDAAALVSGAGLAKDGDLIVITGSSSIAANATNTLQVHIIGGVLAGGQGYGAAPTGGRVHVISGSESADSQIDFSKGDVLVIAKTTNEILRLIKQCRGVITEEAFEESGAAAAAFAMGLPVIAGVDQATRILKSGTSVFIDPEHGYVYNGTSHM